MPELPEVETVRRGLEAHVLGRTIKKSIVRDRRLRRPIDPEHLARSVEGKKIRAIERRAKYLVVRLSGAQTILLHLGMSGRMRIADAKEAVEPHTHVTFALDDGREIRFRDPRRFGVCEAVAEKDLDLHVLLAELGTEPLSDEFRAETFFERSRGSKKPIKNFIMDGKIMVGVGNIYACESLFLAGLRPKRAAGRVDLPAWQRLIAAIRHVLETAIRAGGTTLNDFAGVEGQSGYFQQDLNVYDRHENPCPKCATPIKRVVLAGRSSFFCPNCQK